MFSRLPKEHSSLSSRARRGICFFLQRGALGVSLLIGFAVIAPAANPVPKRPKITGISHVRILVSDYCSALSFYSSFQNPPFGCAKGENRTSGAGFANSHQFIGINTRTSSDQPSSLAEIAFITDDAARLRRYLTSQGISVIGDKKTVFKLRDPDGHLISFWELNRTANKSWKDSLGPRIIHAGFVVRDQAAMDHFYKDILGFRLYWHGGFKDDQTDWVELQVPDGTDWIEYMLNIPADADKKELGIQNHISFGVKDIHATTAQLRKNGIKDFDGPEIGRDGKWSLDAYDPDGTRVEFMEFTPAHPPCCHSYTAEHPKP